MRPDLSDALRGPSSTSTSTLAATGSGAAVTEARDVDGEEEEEEQVHFQEDEALLLAKSGPLHEAFAVAISQPQR